MYKTSTTPFRKSYTNSLISYRYVVAYIKPIIEAFFFLSVYIHPWQSEELNVECAHIKFPPTAMGVYIRSGRRKGTLMAVRGLIAVQLNSDKINSSGENGVVIKKMERSWKSEERSGNPSSENKNCETAMTMA